MNDKKTAYRAFPPEIQHPKGAPRISKEQFDQMQKQRLQDAPSMCEGHLGTEVWYAGTLGYVLKIKLKDRADVHVMSICTFTPTFGMDAIDGSFAQDVEEYILFQELGRTSDRIAIFESKGKAEIMEYLNSRGFQFKKE